MEQKSPNSNIVYYKAKSVYPYFDPDKLHSLARYKILAGRLMSDGWKIEANIIGIPMSRYNHGIIYLRDSQADHPYCQSTYVNIVQKYAGSGTYAATRPVLVADTLVACPAEK